MTYYETLSMVVSQRLAATDSFNLNAIADRVNLPLDHVAALLTGRVEWTYLDVSRFLYHYQWRWKDLEAEVLRKERASSASDNSTGLGSSQVAHYPQYGTCPAFYLFEHPQHGLFDVRRLGIGLPSNWLTLTDRQRLDFAGQHFTPICPCCLRVWSSPTSQSKSTQNADSQHAVPNHHRDPSRPGSHPRTLS